MRRRTAASVALLALALGAAAWLALRDGAPDARGAAGSRGPAAAADVRPNAELAAARAPSAEGETAPSERAAAAPAAPAAGVATSTSEVVIQDARGAPVPYVKWAIFRAAEVLASGVTAADGLASFPGAGEAELAAGRLNCPPQIFPLESDVERQVVTLASGAAVAGIVLVDGFPEQEGLDLWFTSDRELLGAEALPGPVWQALDLPAQALRQLGAGTAEDGAFRFGDLPADATGELTWSERFVLAEGADTELTPGPLKVPAPVEDLVLRLVSAPQITGRVVMPGTGEPIARARVSAAWDYPTGATVSSTSAEEDGTFQFVVTDGLPQHIAVTVTDRERTGAQVYEREIPPGLRVYDVGPLAILPTRAVAFVVRNLAGDAIEGADVTEVPAPRDNRAKVTTDAEGRGTLRVAPGARALRAVAVGCEPAEAQLPAGEEPLVLTLRPGTVLEVRISPAAADLALCFSGAEPPFISDGEPSRWPEPMRLRAAYFADGSFQFQMPKDGIYVLTNVRPDLALTIGVVDAQGIVAMERSVPPLAAGERRVVELTLPLERYTLAGRVRSDDGRALPEARVQVGAVGGQNVRGPNTDDEGFFSIPALAASRVRLVVTHADFAPLLIADQPVVEEPPLELVLERGRTVRASVHRPDGQPVPGATLLLSAGDHPWSLATPAPTPEGFVFEHAPRDALSLTVKAGGRRFERSLPAGSQPAEVDVEVPAWQSCTVRLEGVQGLPGDLHFYVKLNLPGEPLEQTAYAEGGEELRFDVVFPGRYEVYAGAWSMDEADQRWSETKLVEITPDAPATLTLKVSAP